MNVLFLASIFTLVLNSYDATSFNYNENLLVEPLPNANALLHFEFKLKWNKNSAQNKLENYGIFPKQFADIISKFDIDELKLSLAQSTWKYDRWGLPKVSAPSGGEYIASFNKNVNETEVDQLWLQSSRAISGFFGLSINLNENPITVSPKYAFESSRQTSYNLRYASLPNEIVCTENLTPWIKLLPCGKSKGLAQLFSNTYRLFDSHYFLANLHFKQTCSLNEQKCGFELTQTLSLVYNTELLTNQRVQENVEWNLYSIFRKKLESTCPASESTFVHVKSNQFGSLENSKNGVEKFDLNQVLAKTREFNSLIVQNKKASKVFKPFLNVHRYITDQIDRNFGLKTVIQNSHHENLTIVYFDTIPWYFRTYINSLIIKNENENEIINPERINFVPGLDRARPHHIEIKLNLKPKTTYSIYIQEECAHLKWDEYPPDVNHGFYINPALISVTLTESLLKLFDGFNQSEQLRVYTETLIMNLPTPDFSMPYNVICLTCTVIAIGFGSLHNFTTRKFKFYSSKNPKEKIMELVSKIFKQKSN